MMNILASARFWLTGPATFLLAVIVMLGMAIWFPKGEAQVDNIVLPMVAFPLIWAILFFYAYLERNLKRAGWIFLAITLLHMVILLNHFLGGT